MSSTTVPGSASAATTPPGSTATEAGAAAPPAPPAEPMFKKKMDDAKRKHRPGLKLHRWNKDGFAESDVCARLRSFVLSGANADEDGNVHTLTKIDARDLTVAAFIARFEAPGGDARQARPVCIQNTPALERWEAPEKWGSGGGDGAVVDPTAGLRTAFRARRFKCGEDDDGYAVKVKLSHFLKYQATNDDDSPLYIFDSHFDDDAVSKALLGHFAPPCYFRDDLFRLCGERKRPPYRWFLLGPCRSGTNVHIDPLATSAWNTVISGAKLWVIFPPRAGERMDGAPVTRKLVKGRHHIAKGGDDEPINYFAEILPHVKRECKMLGVPVYEFVQLPGETLYVPSGWWHAVLNLEDSVAVTQNFCSHSNFDGVWCETRHGRKKMAVRWLAQLEEHYPALGARARYLNERDGFTMYRHRTPAERAARNAEKEAKEKAAKTAKENKGAANAKAADGAAGSAAGVATGSANAPAASADPTAAAAAAALSREETKKRKREERDRGKRKGVGGGGHYGYVDGRKPPKSGGY